jgi:mannose-1-phosphate guanylyltransferase
MNHRFSIIMAGGSGTRFWPESRQAKPKQLLDLLGTGRSLLRQTYERTARLAPPENIYVVTGESIAEEVGRAIPELSKDGILREPVGRNTAPCIGWAAFRALARDPQALLAVFPSDHAVDDEEEFARVIRAGFDRIEKEDRIVTIGIKPSRPDTGYGYIEAGPPSSGEARQVLRFVEKPGAETAQEYLGKGNFFWNGGIFIFRAGRILGEILEKLPEIFLILQTIQDAFTRGGAAEEKRYAAKLFPTIKGISIDYGVMEKAAGVEVIPADFGWSDLGSWRAIFEKLPRDGSGNAVRGAGAIVTRGAEGCLASVRSGKIAALVGVRDLVVVDTEDALLVCAMDRDQDVREIVAALKKSGKGIT